MKWFYEILYRYFRAPWDIGPRRELVDLVQSGRLKPCRAIDLGSGTASNVIFLAQHGFEVTGVDFAPAAIEKGKRMAHEAGVKVRFVVDDLTDLKVASGQYDLLVDYGTLDDLNTADRDRYVKNVLPLANPGSQFLLYVFEWEMVWWERWISGGGMAVEPGEIQRRFSPYFSIEEITRDSSSGGWPRGSAVYLMTRKGE